MAADFALVTCRENEENAHGEHENILEWRE
jgi:hypothetical protein